MSSGNAEKLYVELAQYLLNDTVRNYDTLRLRIFEKYGSDYILTNGDSYKHLYNVLKKLEEYCDLSKSNLRTIIRLKRIKKQLITHCLEFLSVEWNYGVLVLMRRISNPKHCCRIIQDKSLPYSQEFVNTIFMTI